VILFFKKIGDYRAFIRKIRIFAPAYAKAQVNGGCSSVG
jgi:hypothetical protein